MSDPIHNSLGRNVVVVVVVWPRLVCSLQSAKGGPGERKTRETVVVIAAVVVIV